MGTVIKPIALNTTLSAYSEDEHRDYRRALSKKEMESLCRLVEWRGHELRVMPDHHGTVVAATPAVPETLRNLIVLDASYPIRPMVRVDPTLGDAERNLPAMRITPPPSESKDFSRVVVRQCYRAGGHDAMEQDFGQPYPDQRRACLRIIEVVQSLFKDEAVPIFVFKDKNGVTYEQILRQDMAKAGIDLSATLPVGDENKPRIRIATWGMETSLNRFAYCSNVILAGVLHLPRETITAGMIAQQGDLQADADPGNLSDTESGEVAHVVYQALSRAWPRRVKGGWRWASGTPGAGGLFGK